MTQDNTWFGGILQIMESYCEFFTESRSLAKCTRERAVSPLITNQYVKLNSANGPSKNYNTLTRAFPDNEVFTMNIRHSTTERDLPPAATMLAQAAGLNGKFSDDRIANWNQIGVLNVTRFGPSWEDEPVKRCS